jgi:hypothetical protein
VKHIRSKYLPTPQTLHYQRKPPLRATIIVKSDMASHVVVLDTSLRRATVKLNPGTYMTEILEEACKKWGLKSSNYGLK